MPNDPQHDHRPFELAADQRDQITGRHCAPSFQLPKSSAAGIAFPSGEVERPPTARPHSARARPSPDSVARMGAIDPPRLLRTDIHDRWAHGGPCRLDSRSAGRSCCSLARFSRLRLHGGPNDRRFLFRTPLGRVPIPAPRLDGRSWNAGDPPRLMLADQVNCFDQCHAENIALDDNHPISRFRDWTKSIRAPILSLVADTQEHPQ